MPTATHTLSLSDLFRKAWRLAYEGARYFGGRPASYFRAALKQAWAEARTPAAAAAAMRARVLACAANLAAEYREMERLTAEWDARLGLPGYAPRRAAEVLPFPSRRPAAVPAGSARRVA